MGLPKFKQSQSSMLAGIGDSIGKPIGRFLLASTAGRTATRPTLWKTGAEPGNFWLASFHVVDNLLGGSSCYCWRAFVLSTACLEEAAVESQTSTRVEGRGSVTLQLFRSGKLSTTRKPARGAAPVLRINVQV